MLKKDMSIAFPKPGEIFEKIYKIERLLGKGGFARVYKATELGIGREIALKIFRAPSAQEDESDTQRERFLKTLADRFQREAVMLSRLKCPTTVTLHSYGQSECGLLYMVLEFVDGETLTGFRKKDQRLDAKAFIHILKQTLESLREAHALGMLHRDIKPANIMVYEYFGKKNNVKLLDFGIAKLVDEGSQNNEELTMVGTLVGTPRYMAPEQIQGADMSPASDIYSLGLVCYELLTKSFAIQGDSSIEIVGQQLKTTSVVLPAIANIPIYITEIINKMIKKDPQERFQSVAQILETIEFQVSKDSSGSYSIEESLEFVGIMDSEVEVYDPEVYDPEVDKEDVKKTRKKTTWLIPLLLFVTALLVGGFIVSQKNEPQLSPKKESLQNLPVNTLKEKKEEQFVRFEATRNHGYIRATVSVDGEEVGQTPFRISANKAVGKDFLATFINSDGIEEEVKKRGNENIDSVVFEFIPIKVEEKTKPEDEPKNTAQKASEVMVKMTPTKVGKKKRRKGRKKTVESERNNLLDAVPIKKKEKKERHVMPF